MWDLLSRLMGVERKQVFYDYKGVDENGELYGYLSSNSHVIAPLKLPEAIRLHIILYQDRDAIFEWYDERRIKVSYDKGKTFTELNERVIV